MKGSAVETRIANAVFAAAVMLAAYVTLHSV